MRTISINFGNFKVYAGKKRIKITTIKGKIIAKITVERIISQIFFSFANTPINYIKNIVISHNVEKIFINVLHLKCTPEESQTTINHIKLCLNSEPKQFSFISKEKDGSLFVNMKKGKLFIRKGKNWMLREKTEDGATFKVNDCLNIEQILFKLGTAADKYKIYF